ncbi:MAG TPA: long-chain fatty acid--CoA ligase [Symbiobacteriaceae bacterium]
MRRHLEYPVEPMYAAIYRQMSLHADRAALTFYGKQVSYRELGELSDRFAAALVRRFGIRKGDRVGIMLPNCPQNVIAVLGAQRAGAIPVEFNPMYVPREIEHQAKDSGCKVMLTLDLFWPKVLEAGQIEHYIVTSVKDYLPFPLNLLYNLKAKAPKVPPNLAVRWADFMREPAGDFKPAAVEPQEDAAVLIYTGGTTGVSKGVMLTHYNLCANIMQTQEWAQRGEGRHETVVVVLPMFHSFGFTVSCMQSLASGATCILVPKFDAKELLKIVDKYHPTSLPGVPTIYTALLHDPDFPKHDLTSIEYCVSGAAPLPVELLQKFESASGSKILEGYGLSETSPVTHCNPMHGERVPGSVGLPYPDTEVRVVDLTTGADVELGHEGEILLKGPQVMKGYWNRPQETTDTFVDGWLRTGDIGKQDEDGYLYLVDRMKDMVLSGGFNVYPREIDEVLYQHPAVLEACSVGIPDQYRGESVKSFVVLKPEGQATDQELLAFCKERLAAYKRPLMVEFLPELPKSAVGKVLRRVLAAQEREKFNRGLETELYSQPANHD